MKNLFVCCLLLCGFGIGTSFAQRTYVKEHFEISDATSGTVLAAHTAITSDPDFPFHYRWLVEVANYHMVLRTDQEADNDFSQMTIELLETGESLGIEHDLPTLIRYTIGANEVVTTVAEIMANSGFSATHRSAAETMLGTTSIDFQKALKEFAEIGTYHSLDFRPVSDLLNIFFEDLETTPPNEKPTTKSGRIEAFDPLVDPPDAFDLQFGDAYFN